MTRVTHHSNGVILINGRRYQRSQFAAAEPTFKDWLLWSLIMLGFVLSGVLAAAGCGFAVWLIVQLVRRYTG